MGTVVSAKVALTLLLYSHIISEVITFCDIKLAAFLYFIIYAAGYGYANRLKSLCIRLDSSLPLRMTVFDILRSETTKNLYFKIS